MVIDLFFAFVGGELSVFVLFFFFTSDPLSLSPSLFVTSALDLCFSVFVLC